MSFNWENTVWQSKNGTWNIGLYVRVPGHTTDEDGEYDREWDDDYDFTKFSYGYSGLGSPEQVHIVLNRRGHTNPGLTSPIPYTKQTAADCDEWDDMLKAANDPAYAVVREERIRKQKVAAFRKNLRENLRKEENTPKVNGMHDVIFGSKDYDGYGGMTTSMRGILTRDGDWLILTTREWNKARTQRVEKKVRVWNVEKRTPAPTVVGIQRRSSRWV